MVFFLPAPCARPSNTKLFFAPVLVEKVVLPALARARDEEPIVVETDLVAAQLVRSVALLGGRLSACALGKVAVVNILKSIGRALKSSTIQSALAKVLSYKNSLTILERVFVAKTFATVRYKFS